jgi:hypothetical protein
MMPIDLMLALSLSSLLWLGIVAAVWAVWP